MTKAARFWAGVDLVATGILALPFLARPFVELVHELSGAELPAFAPIHWFFVSLAGALGVIWAIVRLRDPRRALVLTDTIGRVWVAGLIAWFVLAGAPPALLAFVATELGGALHQAIALRRSAS